KELGSLGNTPPKEGDKVLVRDCDEDDWIERIYLYTLPSICASPYVAVPNSHEERYIRGEKVDYVGWKQMKPIQENTFKEIREGIPSEDLGTVFEVEFCLESLGIRVRN
ncbi:MAG: hypothetical protein ACPGDB_05400, partial [Fusobacterium sp.]